MNYKTCIQIMIRNILKMFSNVPGFMSDVSWEFHENSFMLTLLTDRLIELVQVMAWCQTSVKWSLENNVGPVL